MTKQFNTGLGSFLAVDMLKGARFQGTNEDGFYMLLIMDENGKPVHRLDLPPNYYKIIALQSEIENSEELAKMVVEKINKEPNVPIFNFYDNSDKITNSSSTSFQSLMQKEELWLVNPYGEKPSETFNHPSWEYVRHKFEQAQLKVSERLILKAI